MRSVRFLIWALLLVPIGCNRRPGDIYKAAQQGDATEVSRLLAFGADPNKPDAGGLVPLLWAVETPNNGEMISLLLRHGASLKTPNGGTLLSGDSSNVPQLVAAGVDVNWHGPGAAAPIVVVAETGDTSAVQLLIDHGADLNLPDSAFVLEEAIVKGHIPVLKLLLKAGMKFGPDKGGSALREAVRQDNLEAIRVLLDYGADAKYSDQYGRNLVTAAILRSRPQVIEMLIAAGADVNQKDIQGATPLHIYNHIRSDPATGEILRSHGAKDEPSDK